MERELLSQKVTAICSPLKGMWKCLFLCSLTNDGHKYSVLAFADLEVNLTLIYHFLLNNESSFSLFTDDL